MSTKNISSPLKKVKRKALPKPFLSPRVLKRSKIFKRGEKSTVVSKRLTSPKKLVRKTKTKKD